MLRSFSKTTAENWTVQNFCSQVCIFFGLCRLHSRTTMARTHLEPWKYVRDRGRSSLRVLTIATGQEA